METNATKEAETEFIVVQGLGVHEIGDPQILGLRD